MDLKLKKLNHFSNISVYTEVTSFLLLSQEFADALRELAPNANQQETAEEAEKRARRMEDTKQRLEQVGAHLLLLLEYISSLADASVVCS